MTEREDSDDGRGYAPRSAAGTTPIPSRRRIRSPWRCSASSSPATTRRNLLRTYRDCGTRCATRPGCRIFASMIYATPSRLSLRAADYRFRSSADCWGIGKRPRRNGMRTLPPTR
jgi:hypothetical protein